MTCAPFIDVEGSAECMPTPGHRHIHCGRGPADGTSLAPEWPQDLFEAFDLRRNWILQESAYIWSEETRLAAVSNTSKNDAATGS
jgi:hypothetical protein